MDVRQVQADKRSSRREYSALHPAGSHGLEMAGGRQYETLVAQGHYRCSHCRRADIDEINAGARRMR